MWCELMNVTRLTATGEALCRGGTLEEYAARVCYRSTGSIGRSPGFIARLVHDRGHEDVIEHVFLTFWTDGMETQRWSEANRYLIVRNVGDGMAIVGGNARVWLDLKRRGLLPSMVLVHLERELPEVFAERSS